MSYSIIRGPINVNEVNTAIIVKFLSNWNYFYDISIPSNPFAFGKDLKVIFPYFCSMTPLTSLLTSLIGCHLSKQTLKKNLRKNYLQKIEENNPNKNIF